MQRKQRIVSTTGAFENRLRENPPREHYVLCLYVAGMTPRSTEAVEAIRALCEQYLPGRYELDVIDLYQRPALARDQQVIAAPTLIRELPAPLRRLVGNLADRERVLSGLGLNR